MQKLEKPYVFDSIHEMPLFCWFHLLSSGNLAYLKKSSVNQLEDVDKKEAETLLQLYYKLFDQYHDAFGQSNQSGKLRILTEKLFEAQNNYLQKQKRHLLNKIKFCEYELKKHKENSNNGPSVWESIPILEMHYHFEMNPKKTSVFAFYSRMNSRNKVVAEKNKANVG